MSAFRAIPIDVHAALEVAAAPLLIVAPFALDFGYLAGALSIALGILLVGLASSVYGDASRGSVPLSAHAGLDHILAAATIALLTSGCTGREAYENSFALGWPKPVTTQGKTMYDIWLGTTAAAAAGDPL